MSEENGTIMVLLSNESSPPDAARKLWPNDKIGMKMQFPTKGKGMMNVFFPATDKMRRKDGGWKVNWKWLRDNLKFEEHEGGTLKGVYVGK